jgi:hypothetical protein
MPSNMHPAAGSVKISESNLPKPTEDLNDEDVRRGVVKEYKIRPGTLAPPMGTPFVAIDEG